MPLELDHFFVCTSPGAPAAEELIGFGLREGDPNTHPGQGTVCRRFSFLNAMIELVWVSNPAEAQSPSTRPTLLWERWSSRDSGASPFGICVRPTSNLPLGAAPRDGDPFAGWAYKPSYLPEPLQLFIGDAGVEEPMWVYFDFMRRAMREAHFKVHPIGIREVTGLVIHTPIVLESEASRVVASNGVFSAYASAHAHLLEIEFDHHRRASSQDFRPSLPLMFRY
jgi:hypothetical protein